MCYCNCDPETQIILPITNSNFGKKKNTKTDDYFSSIFSLTFDFEKLQSAFVDEVLFKATTIDELQLQFSRTFNLCRTQNKIFLGQMANSRCSRQQKLFLKKENLYFNLLRRTRQALSRKTKMSFGTDYYVIKFNGLKINTLTMYSYRRLINSLRPT